MQESQAVSFGGDDFPYPLPSYMRTKAVFREFTALPFDAPQFSVDRTKVLPNRPVQLQAATAGYGLYPLKSNFGLTPYQHAIATVISQAVQVKDVYVDRAVAAAASKESMARSRTVMRDGVPDKAATRNQTVPPNYHSKYAGRFQITKEIARSRTGIFTKENRMEPEDATQYVRDKLKETPVTTEDESRDRLAHLATMPMTLDKMRELQQLGSLKSVNQGSMEKPTDLLGMYMSASRGASQGPISAYGSRIHALMSRQDLRTAKSATIMPTMPTRRTIGFGPTRTSKF